MQDEENIFEQQQNNNLNENQLLDEQTSEISNDDINNLSDENKTENL